MVDHYKIIEYCNPSFPDKPYYKVDLDGTIYHTSDLDKAHAARQAHIDMREHYKAKALRTAKAMEIWMRDEPYKD